MLTFGSLFAGIGGIDLGLERAGMRCVWQVEIDDYCRRVLAKHWPDVRRHDDVRTFPPTAPEEWRCDLIAGGFPCQDISNAGQRAGIEGERSGLWREYARIIGLVRPDFVLVENVAALLGRGMGRVLADISALGYDAEWEVLPCAAFGAPHLRERLFIIAHLNREQRRARRQGRPAGGDSRLPLQPQTALLNSDQGRRSAETSADVDGERRQEFNSAALTARAAEPERILALDAHGDEARRKQESSEQTEGRWVPYPVKRFSGARGPWRVEPDVVRVVHGVPARVDRIRGLGNAVVPQIAEWLGRRILAAQEQAT